MAPGSPCHLPIPGQAGTHGQALPPAGPRHRSPPPPHTPGRSPPIPGKILLLLLGVFVGLVLVPRQWGRSFPARKEGKWNPGVCWEECGQQVKGTIFPL